TSYWRDWSSDVCSSDLRSIDGNVGCTFVGNMRRHVLWSSRRGGIEIGVVNPWMIDGAQLTNYGFADLAQISQRQLRFVQLTITHYRLKNLRDNRANGWQTGLGQRA